MAKRLVPVLLLCLPVLLCGCRMRIIQEKENANVILPREEQGVVPTDALTESLQEEQPRESETTLEEPTEDRQIPEESHVVAPVSSPSESPSTGNTPGQPNPGTDYAGSGGDVPNASESNGGTTSPPKAEIKVTLNANGGRCTPASTKSLWVAKGGTYEGLPQAKRGGYLFAGWFTEKTGGVQVFDDTTVISEQNHTLYAHWTAQTSYTLTFDPTVGWLGASPDSVPVYAGQAYAVSFPKPYASLGYTFVGWFTEKDGGTQVVCSDIFQGDRDITLYAQWLYDPIAYWSGYLQNAAIYDCQIQRVYIEYDADHVTTSYSPLLSMARTVNAARTFSDVNTTDAQVREAAPNAIVKCVSNMGNAAAYYAGMNERFPGKRIYIVPQSAEWGGAAQNIYYALYLASLIYPDALGGLDMNAVAADLGVSGSIYYQ